jgi:hypothetical protein
VAASRGKVRSDVTLASRGVAVDPLAAGVLRDAKHVLGQVLGNDRVPPDAMVPMLLPLLWVLRAAGAGAPPNVCVDACETLRWG